MMFPVTLSCGHSLCRPCCLDHFEVLSNNTRNLLQGEARCPHARCAVPFHIPAVNTTLQTIIEANYGEQLAERKVHMRPMTELKERERMLQKRCKRFDARRQQTTFSCIGAWGAALAAFMLTTNMVLRSGQSDVIIETPPQVQYWTPGAVEAWLRSHGLERHADAAHARTIDGYGVSHCPFSELLLHLESGTPSEAESLIAQLSAGGLRPLQSWSAADVAAWLGLVRAQRLPKSDVGEALVGCAVGAAAIAQHGSMGNSSSRLSIPRWSCCADGAGGALLSSPPCGRSRFSGCDCTRERRCGSWRRSFAGSRSEQRGGGRGGRKGRSPCSSPRRHRSERWEGHSGCGGCVRCGCGEGEGALDGAALAALVYEQERREDLWGDGNLAARADDLDGGEGATLLPHPPRNHALPLELCERGGTLDGVAGHLPTGHLVRGDRKQGRLHGLDKALLRRARKLLPPKTTFYEWRLEEVRDGSWLTNLLIGCPRLLLLYLRVGPVRLWGSSLLWGSSFDLSPRGQILLGDSHQQRRLVVRAVDRIGTLRFWSTWLLVPHQLLIEQLAERKDEVGAPWWVLLLWRCWLRARHAKGLALLLIAARQREMRRCAVFDLVREVRCGLGALFEYYVVWWLVPLSIPLMSLLLVKPTMLLDPTVGLLRNLVELGAVCRTTMRLRDRNFFLLLVVSFCLREVLVDNFWSSSTPGAHMRGSAWTPDFYSGCTLLTCAYAALARRSII